MLIPWITLAFQCIINMYFINLFPEYTGVFAFISIVINAISVYIGIKKEFKNKDILTLIAWIGFSLRLIFLIWDLNCRNIFVLPNSGLDTETFAIFAESGFLYGDYGRIRGYSKFIAFWYNFFGIERVIPQYINVLLGTTQIMLCYRICKMLNLKRFPIYICVFLLSVLPNTLIMNAILLRETIICFIVALSVYMFVKWQVGGGLHYVIYAMVFSCIGAYFHSGAIAALLGEAVVYCLYDKRSKTIKLKGKSIVMAAVCICIFFAIYALLGDALFGKFARVESAEDIVGTAEYYDNGGAAYNAGFAINNTALNLIVNTPIRMLYFVVSPMPWDWRGLQDIIAFFFSSTVFGYAYYSSIVNLKKKLGTKEKRTLILSFLIFALCSAAVFAWGVSNSGTALRHREKFLFIYIVLIGLCIDNRYANTNTNLEVKN